MKTFCGLLFALFIFLICGSTPVSAQQLVEGYQAVIKGRSFVNATVGADGNYLIGGSIDYFGNDLSGAIIKVNQSGDLVQGFNKIVADGDVYDILPLEDGKVLVSGRFTKVNGEPSAKVVKFNADGSVDQSFSLDAPDEIRVLGVQSTGKIIIAGLFSNFMGKGYANVVRLNADGSLDESFINGSSASVSALSVNENDEIFLNQIGTVVKLTPGGAVDVTFTLGLAGRIQVDDFDVLPDGKSFIVVSDFSAQVPTFSLFRLNSDGSVDATFPELEMPSYISSCKVLSSGDFVLAGNFTQYNGEPANVVLFNADGTFDRVLAVTDINSTGPVLEDQSNGLIILGEFREINGQPNMFIARLNADYTMDADFRPEITRGLFGAVGGMQFDGKLVVGGSSFDFLGADNIRSTLVRLNVDGTADHSFVPEISAYAHIFCAEVQPDDKILVGGSSLSDDFSAGFKRLLPDGAQDNAFNIGAGPQFGSDPSYVRHVRYHKRKIYVAGPFTMFNDQPYERFVILDQDGNIIGPDNKTLPANSEIDDIEVQSDGKIVLMGFFNFSDTFKPRLIRLMADGSVDSSFPGVMVTNGLLRDIAIDSQDRIIVMGVFEELNGVPVKDIARLNADGTIDPTLNTGTGVDQDVENSILSVTVLPTDIIALSGSFEFYNGESSPGLVFLEPSGETIPFSADINPVSNISHVIFRNNTLYGVGRIVFGRGEKVSSALKVSFDLPVSVEPSATVETIHPIPVFPNPFHDALHIAIPTDSRESTVKIFSANGALLREHRSTTSGTVTLQVGDLPTGLFLLRVQSGRNTLKSVKLIKK